jgi:hypothetical protein
MPRLVNVSKDKGDFGEGEGQLEDFLNAKL